MLMIRPRRLFIIGRAAARVNRNVPRRLMLITASHCSSFMRTMTLSRVMPALLTRMSSVPHSLTTSSTTSPTRSLSVTSQAIGSAVPPAARMAATVSASLSHVDVDAGHLGPRRGQRSGRCSGPIHVRPRSPTPLVRSGWLKFGLSCELLVSQLMSLPCDVSVIPSAPRIPISDVPNPESLAQVPLSHFHALARDASGRSAAASPRSTRPGPTS